mgnify:CR=1 FL=1
MGLSRQKDVYICNTLKCRPPDNRDPLPDEKAACREYLDAQIEILKPRIILLCGRVAVNSLLGTTQGITKIRGKWFEGPNMSKMMPIFHPSYLLRNDSREKGSPKWLMWQDIQEIKRVYSQMDQLFIHILNIFYTALFFRQTMYYIRMKRIVSFSITHYYKTEKIITAFIRK